ncbi:MULTISPECIES: DUF4190 domain-containing protein [unclassified Microbacterium]|uniref:DUF4190 domain-containing protein n=1 Tax=unclassified Microbacterium TaxID=2609290 RepID=UPI00214CC7A0|nr:MULTISPECIES: DUF4190 domain-containing protein [unclassified Microbacterium]MCR2785787.1 DUF4190 domain-containing protein [Microbacterium sp. zg.B96]MDL5350096.1 DUF4190 domain-containing protein [Microbacterium sp. zg-YB36]WIM17233.1 DUF4190 domain-containing protein [Microbacterium sp. zg-B96]
MSTPDSTPPAEGTNEPAPPTPPAYSPPPYTPPPAYSPPQTYAPPTGQPSYPAAQQPYPAAQPPYPAQPPYTEQPAYGAPAAQPGAYPPPAYNAYGQAPYGAGYGYSGVKTNVLAIVSMIASIVGAVGILPIIGSIAGAIMGHIALKQIATTGEKGRGMALAGVIVGWVGLGLVALIILIFVLAAIGVSNSTMY